jgi:TatD family-associated radical SAM protein
MATIAYPIGDSLYLNLTNRCTNECPFCIRNLNRQFEQKYDLWLDREPTAEELIAAIGDPAKHKQIVFCGYGEPLVRLDAVKAVATQLATRNPKPVTRIDTNGTANLFWGRNILPELKGLIDSISISLNAQDAATYNKLCRPQLGPESYDAVVDFIKEAKQYIPQVEASVVDLPTVDKEACKKIAAKLGVSFRVRPYYKENYVR